MRQCDKYEVSHRRMPKMRYSPHEFESRLSCDMEVKVPEWRKGSG